MGDLDAAEAHLEEAAGLILATPQPATAALALVGAALVAAGRDRPEQAARLLAAAEATRERAGVAAVGAEAVEAELAGRGRPGRARPRRPGGRGGRRASPGHRGGPAGLVASA